MSVRRVLFWIAANLSLVIIVALATVVWVISAGPHKDLAGPNATGRSFVIPIGLLMLIIAVALIALNAAWAVVVVVRKRHAPPVI